MLELGAAASSSGPAAGPDTEPESLLHLRSAGVSVVVRHRRSSLPVVLHWGADLGDLGALDPATVLAVLGPLDLTSQPVELPAIVRAGRRRSAPRVSSHARLISGRSVEAGLTQVGADTLVVQVEDEELELSIDLAVQLTESGLLRCRAGVVNQGDDPYRLDGLDLMLPVPEAASHRIELDPAADRRHTPLGPDALVVESWGTEARPALLTLGVPEAGFRRGSVWQVHVAFGGAVRHRVARALSGPTCLGGGELWPAGEIVLSRGQSYHSPWVVFAWADGLDQAMGRVHDHQRSRADPVASSVVFDAAAPAFAQHDRRALVSLAEYAAAVGAETFVLDLGWCVRSGLGPETDLSTGATEGRDVPHDLDHLLARIRDLDLTPGFAIDPELVEVGSDIARDHPDWLVGAERGGGVRLLDLSVRPAMVHVWERLTKLLDRCPVGLLVWAVDPGAPDDGFGSNRHARALAGYRLLDALRERYPGMSIRSADLDLATAGRVGVVDPATDARTRHLGFSGLSQLLAPERISQVEHDEPVDATSAAFRAVSGFFGQLGLGFDLNRQTPGSLRSIHRWIALHKTHRPLLHTGRTVRSDQSDRSLLVHGVVALDQGEALFAVVWLDRCTSSQRIRIDGLDPEGHYEVGVVGVRSDPVAVGPSWAGPGAGPHRLTGVVLATVGVTVPPARRGSTLLVHLTAVDRSG